MACFNLCSLLMPLYGRTEGDGWLTPPSPTTESELLPLLAKLLYRARHRMMTGQLSIPGRIVLIDLSLFLLRLVAKLSS